jgi:hypothetical protein
LVRQDISKYRIAQKVFDKIISSGKLKVSFLTMQETAYVLHRLGLEKHDIESTLTTFLTFEPVSYEVPEMQRAISLCKNVGFQYTFNKSDFRRIARLSKLKVVLLE